MNIAGCKEKTEGSGGNHNWKYGMLSDFPSIISLAQSVADSALF